MVNKEVRKPLGRIEEHKDGHTSFYLSHGPGEPKTVMQSLEYHEPGASESYLIPLGKVRTCRRDEVKPLQNVLVPVAPLRYTADHKPQAARWLRSDGWLYTFRQMNGRWQLWREQQVRQWGYLDDVNLKRVRELPREQRHTRKATVPTGWRLMVPYLIEGQVQPVQLAFSEVQWSWDYIEYLEGNDEARSRRTQDLNCQNHRSAFVPLGPEGNQALVDNIANAPQDLNLADFERDSNIACVYLHDPLGIARDYSDALQTVTYRLMDALKAAQALETVTDPQLKAIDPGEKNAYWKAAVLAYRTYFDPDLAQKPTTVYNELGQYETTENTDIGKGAASVDRAYLEKLLDVEQRRELRAMFRQLRQTLVYLLDAKDEDGNPLTDRFPDLVTVNDALRDYANLDGADYLRLWAAMSDIVLLLGMEPCALDDACEIASVSARERREPNPGRDYLAALLKPDHPLHPMLFPAASDIDVTQIGTVTAALEAADGSGRFRPQAFAYACQQPHTTLHAVLGGLFKTIDTFLAQFARTFETTLTGEDSHQELGKLFAPLLRLFKVGGRHELVLVPPGTQVDFHQYTVADAAALASAGRLIRPEPPAQAPPGTVPLKERGKVVAFVKKQELASFRGMEPGVTAKQWQGVLGEVRDGQLTTRSHLILLDKNVPEAEVFHNSPANTPAPATGAAATPDIQSANPATRAAAAISPVIALLAGWNCLATFKALRHGGTKTKINFGVALVAFGHASTDAAIKIFGEAPVAEFAGRPSGQLGRSLEFVVKGRIKFASPAESQATANAFEQIGDTLTVNKGVPKFLEGKELSIFKGLGAGLTGAAAIMSAWDAGSALAQDDDDAAAAHSVSALALGGLAGVEALGAAGITFGGPPVWILAGIAVAAAVAAQMLTDTGVEQWAKHGPFAQDAAKRMTHDYQGKNYTDAFHGLLNLLMAPALKLTTSGPGSLNARVLLPGFTPEQSALSVECSAESGRRDISYIPPGSTNLSSWNDDQQLIKPVEAEVWLEEGDTQPRGYIYRYYLGAPPQGDKCQWRVRARHITPQGAILPLPERDKKAYDPHRVQESDAKSGWLYAERTEP